MMEVERRSGGERVNVVQVPTTNEREPLSTTGHYKP